MKDTRNSKNPGRRRRSFIFGLLADRSSDDAIPATFPRQRCSQGSAGSLRRELVMTRSIARLLLIIVAALGTSAALAAQRTYDKQLDAPPGGRLTFDADVGSVVVVGRDAPKVVLHADLQGSESFLAGFRISTEQTPSGVTVSAHTGNHGWLDW